MVLWQIMGGPTSFQTHFPFQPGQCAYQWQPPRVAWECSLPISAELSGAPGSPRTRVHLCYLSAPPKYHGNGKHSEFLCFQKCGNSVFLSFVPSLLFRLSFRLNPVRFPPEFPSVPFVFPYFCGLSSPKKGGKLELPTVSCQPVGGSRNNGKPKKYNLEIRLLVVRVWESWVLFCPIQTTLEKLC